MFRWRPSTAQISQSSSSSSDRARTTYRLYGDGFGVIDILKGAASFDLIPVDDPIYVLTLRCQASQ